MVPVIGLGTGGHAKVLLDVLQSAPRFRVIGLLDVDRARIGESLMGVRILGDDSLLPQLQREHPGLLFFIGVGSIGQPDARKRAWQRALDAGLQPIDAIVHASAVVSASAKLGRGAMVLPGAIINAEARTGENVIINTRAVVEHDCILGDHVHIATGACLCGEVEVKTGAHVGAASVVRQGLVVGAGAIVGAGACVVRDVPEGAVVMGVPAREFLAKK